MDESPQRPMGRSFAQPMPNQILNRRRQIRILRHVSARDPYCLWAVNVTQGYHLNQVIQCHLQRLRPICFAPLLHLDYSS